MPPSAAAGERPLFHAHITPGRSLDHKGHIVVVGGVGAVALVLSLILVARGYWPIAPFLGAEVGLLAWAFWAMRQPVRVYEELTVLPDSILIRRAAWRRPVVEISMPTAWTQLERDDDPDFGCQALRLRHRGRSASVAAMLSPPERDAFAAALSEALHRARRGGLAARGG
jgi:uncharacterized membrane protein